MDVLVHGGAGGAPEDPKPRQAVLDEAATAGAACDTPVDAVETAVRLLETDEQFNAGVGGARQSDGVVRTDAGLMRSDRSVGAACSMPDVEHAVSVAREVMERTPHILLAGEQAVAFADDIGVPVGGELLTDRSIEKWAELDPPADGPLAQLEWVSEQFGDTGDGRWAADTVGAVARAGDTFAAATSTGGRWLALAGRVGDVPQVGSGFYAGPAGAASATGAGEDIARVTLCRQAITHLEAGRDAESAATEAIESFEAITGSSAGIIVMGPDGMGTAYNSDAMQTSAATSD